MKGSEISKKIPASILVEAIELARSHIFEQHNSCDLHPAMQHLYVTWNNAECDKGRSSFIPVLQVDKNSDTLYFVALPTSSRRNTKDMPIILKRTADKYYDRYGWIVFNQVNNLPIGKVVSEDPARTSISVLRTLPELYPAIWQDLTECRKLFDLNEIHQTIKQLCSRTHDNASYANFDLESAELNTICDGKKIYLYFEIDSASEKSSMFIDGQKAIEIAAAVSRNPDSRLFDASTDLAWVDILHSLKLNYSSRSATIR